jgi:trimethylamine:corrinoid methyltransferase-like protein
MKPESGIQDRRGPTYFCGVEADRVVTDAIRVLDTVGVGCPHERTQRALVGAGVAVCREDRLHFRPDCVAAHLATRQPPPVPLPEEFGLGGQWNCLNLCEPCTRRVRPATRDEVIAMARLAEALGKRGGPVPVAPAYMPPRLRTLEAERVGLLYTRHCGGLLTATDRTEIRYLAEMNLAAGRRYRLGLEGMMSPLRINPEIMDCYFENCDDPDLDIAPMGAIPMAGATAPLVLPAALVQSVAETIAWDTVLYHVSEGRHRCLSLRLDPFDPRDANIAIGTPEWCIFRQAVIAVHEHFFGCRPARGAFRSNARVPDMQAQVQRTASALWQAQLGARVFGAVGQICMDEVFSPVQAIYDREILHYVERLHAGLEPLLDEEADSVAVVRQGVREGTYLAAQETVERCRGAFLFSELFDARNLGAWRAAGEPDREAEAWDEAQSLIAAHGYEANEAVTRDVETIYRKASGALCD